MFIRNIYVVDGNAGETDDDVTHDDVTSSLLAVFNLIFLQYEDKVSSNSIANLFCASNIDLKFW